MMTEPDFLVYLTGPRTADSSAHTSDQEEPNRYDLIVETVRSQKSITRETSSPTFNRFTTPPPSPRRPHQPMKVHQSVSVPYRRASPFIDQESRHGTKVRTDFDEV